jgi:AraC-like DNA-binding protein
MTPEEGRMYLQKLQAKMAQDKPYLETELTLPRLSECLSMPQHDLSRVINESLNQNFFDFVNGYRVEEAKRLLVDPAKSAHTILDIALEAGFNSKTTFNGAFKKITGKTPSEFRLEMHHPTGSLTFGTIGTNNK